MTLTIVEAINKTADYLNQKGIESARLNAELLLAHVLKCRRINLYLNYETPLTSNELENFRELIKRRLKFEPLQYILGKTEFFGLEFEVNPSVLIPRPETELLIETVLETIDKNRFYNILDVGSGSGNIAITLAKNIPDVMVTGIEISDEAIATSKRNAKLHQVEDKIIFVKKNIFEVTDLNNDQFDYIVSNPPYISISDYAKLAPELLNYEPKIALTDCGDGLTFYKRIVDLAETLLKIGGKIFFEIGVYQAEMVNKILLDAGFDQINIRKDYANINRIIYGVRV